MLDIPQLIQRRFYTPTRILDIAQWFEKLVIEVERTRQFLEKLRIAGNDGERIVRVVLDLRETRPKRDHHAGNIGGLIYGHCCIDRIAATLKMC